MQCPQYWPNVRAECSLLAIGIKPFACISYPAAYPADSGSARAAELLLLSRK